MTHQELLENWLQTYISLAYEMSGDIRTSVLEACQQAEDYVREHELVLPHRVEYERGFYANLDD